MDQQETAEDKLEKIANTTHLKTAIERLEIRRTVQEGELKEKYHEMLVSLKPGNILRSTLQEVRESTPLKHNLLKVAVGLGAGYFSRKMVVAESAGVVKKALGAALQYGITNFIARKPDNDGDGSGSASRLGFIKKLFRKKQPA